MSYIERGCIFVCVLQQAAAAAAAELASGGGGGGSVVVTPGLGWLSVTSPLLLPVC